MSALETLTWASVDPPARWRDYRSQLAPADGQLEAVEAASSALAAAQSTDGLDDNIKARLDIISAAWYVPATLIKWTNSKTPPSAKEQEEFWTRFSAVEADNRTMWRTSTEDLMAYVAKAVEYAVNTQQSILTNIKEKS